MSYRNLIDVGLNVDTSELEETLGRIDQNVEVLTDRVKSIEDGGYPVDEDKVHDLIATYISDEGIITEQGIDGKLQDYVSSDDLDSLVDDYLRNNEYVTSDDFEQKVRDLAHDEGVLTGDNLESSTPFSDLVQRVECLENDLNQDGTIQDKVNEALEPLVRRIADLEALVEEQRGRNDTAMTFFDLIKQAFALLQRGS